MEDLTAIKLIDGTIERIVAMKVEIAEILIAELMSFHAQRETAALAQTQDALVIVAETGLTEVNVMRIEITTFFVVPARRRIDKASLIKLLKLFRQGYGVELPPTFIKEGPFKDAWPRRQYR